MIMGASGSYKYGIERENQEMLKINVTKNQSEQNAITNGQMMIMTAFACGNKWELVLLFFPIFSSYFQRFSVALADYILDGQ